MANKMLSLHIGTWIGRITIGVTTLIVLYLTGITASRAHACPYLEAASQHALLVDGGFTLDDQAGELPMGYIWLELADVPSNAHFVVLEPVWGSGPNSLSDMWSSAHEIRGGHVAVLPKWRALHGDQPFTLGLRVRLLLDDGRLSAPSRPVFLTHAGQKTEGGLTGADYLFVLLGVTLFALWAVFRRERSATQRVRIAAMVGLVSLLFLAVTPSLAWLDVSDASAQLPDVGCHLGDERQCATYVPDSGPNPMSLSDVSLERHLEVQQWLIASSAMRLGLILCFVLLVPALIWLIVMPRLRAAQAVVAIGASSAGYTFLSTILYAVMVPSWMTIDMSRAFDVTLVASANIMIASAMVIHWSFRPKTPEVPQARARIR